MYFTINVLGILALISFGFGATLPRNGCEISVNKDLSNPQPLLLLLNNSTSHIDAFPLPIDAKGTLVFATNEVIDIACPGGRIKINNVEISKDVTRAKCISQVLFLIENKQVPISEVTCSKNAFHSSHYTGKLCAKSFKEIEIGFQVKNRFINHITTCFNNDLQHAIYSYNVIPSSIAGSQTNYPRPNFQTGSYYDVKPSTLYTQKEQRKTINTILGYPKNDNSTIQPNTNFFLATGHYTPKADFVFGTQQRLTFYYINAAPQWQTFNGGNWNTMESSVRSLANSRKLHLHSYTGSYGVTTLLDINKKSQELYLWANGKERAIPVPHLFYKVLYVPSTQAGIALIGVNNPYNSIKQSDIICKDVSNRVTWIKWKPQNVTLGYSYCCEVDDFRTTINDIPYFPVKSLLT